MIRAVIILTFAGCSIGPVDFTGKQCPCPEGYLCDDATQTCTRSPATGDDAANDTPTDTPPATSCIVVPFTAQIYKTPDFADFVDWNVGGGQWALGSQEVVQTSTNAQLSFISHAVSANDYRVVATMHATSGGTGNAIEIALRIAAPDSNMYHCNWEPQGGAFIIQRTDNINSGITLQEITINTDQIPDYTPTSPVTMEFQAIGSSFECCLRGIQGASLTGNDGAYLTGDVGVKTYQMAGGFSDFEVYAQ